MVEDKSDSGRRRVSPNPPQLTREDEEFLDAFGTYQRCILLQNRMLCLHLVKLLRLPCNYLVGMNLLYFELNVEIRYDEFRLRHPMACQPIQEFSLYYTKSCLNNSIVVKIWLVKPNKFHNICDLPNRDRIRCGLFCLNCHKEENLDRYYVCEYGNAFLRPPPSPF